MKFFEFDTKADGDIIRLPDEHSEFFNKEIHITVVLKDGRKNADGHNFNACRLKTKEYKFNRENAHER